jgi:hypothetical protein
VEGAAVFFSADQFNTGWDIPSVDKSEVSSTSTVKATKGTTVVIWGKARNPEGGVQRFSLTVTDGSKTLYDATTTSAPDADGEVAETLLIATSNGAGGVGNQQLAFAVTSNPINVAATAVNFNNMATSLVVTYVPTCPVSSCNVLGGTVDQETCFCICPSGQPPCDAPQGDVCCEVGNSHCCPGEGCLPQWQKCCEISCVISGVCCGSYCCQRGESCCAGGCCPTGTYCCGDRCCEE